MNIQEYVMPELLVLIPVLVAIGAAIKKTGKVASTNIPWILGVCGIAMTTLYVMANCVPFDTPAAVMNCILTAIVQGILVAAGAVYAHQVYKQGKKQMESKDDEKL